MQGQSYYSIPFYVQFMKKNQLFGLDLNIISLMTKVSNITKTNLCHNFFLKSLSKYLEQFENSLSKFFFQVHTKQ